jgi:hypothetical protein
VSRAIVVAALLVGAVLRCAWPHADPPERLSWSSGIYTDPTSQTLAARATVEGRRAYAEDRVYLHAFPLANGLVWAAFRLLGVDRQQMQWTAALVGTAMLAAVAMAVRRAAGDRAMAIAAALGAVSYWTLMFGRVPLTEHVVAMVLAASAYFALGSGRRDAVIAGALGTAGVLLGKYHAAPYILALALFLAWRSRRAGAVLPAVIGGAPVFLAWLVVVFLPNRAELLAYVGRESTGAHGPVPFTLDPVSPLTGFFHNVRAAWLFHHAPVAGTVGAVAALWMLLHGPARRRAVGEGTALFALWFVTAWTYHALLPYRAPRYFLVLAPPLLVCAAVALDRMLGGRRLPVSRLGPRPLIAAAPCAFFAAFVLVDLFRHYAYLLLLRRDIVSGQTTALVDSLIRATGALTDLGTHFRAATVVFALAAFAYAGVAALPRRSPRTLDIRKLAMTLLAAGALFDAGRFAAWATHRKYATEAVSTALPGIVGDGAVVIGSFAPLVTLGTEVAPISLIGSLPAGDVLADRGVTHLLLAEPADHAQLLDRYPDLEARTVSVETWAMGTRFVRTLELRRLREPRGAGTAYVPTPFERAAEAMAAGRWQEAIARLEEQAAGGGETAEVLAKRAACRFQLGERERAKSDLQAAVRLRPDDALLLRHLGMLALAEGDVAGARAWWSRAVRFEPENPDLAAVIREGLAQASAPTR